MTATDPIDSKAVLLDVHSIGAGYGDLRAVWDVSLQVRPGEVTALIGRNGAGKTTTLRAVAGLNRLMAGSIVFDGRDISTERVHRRVRRGIALVQEGKRIFRRLSVEENLLLGGYSQRIGRRALLRRLGEVYEVFPILADRARTTAGQLSGGQQQMVAIGQALMSKPRVLMLDEPSGGLAPAVVTEVMSSVRRLAETGLGVLLVEQAIEDTMRISDRVLVLDVGRTVLDRPTRDITDLDVLRQAYFGWHGAPTAD